MRVFISMKKNCPSESSKNSNRVVVDRPGAFHRRRADLVSQRIGQARGGGLFKYLLVAALQRAIARAQVDHAAVHVAQHLHLDVPGPVQVTFQIDIGVAECQRGLTPGHIIGLLKFVLGAHHAHPPSTPAPGRFHQQRVANLVGDNSRLVGVKEGIFGAGDDGQPSGAHQFARFDFVRHGLDRLGTWADESNPYFLTDLSHVRVLR
jgi:hypothetical protein